MNPQTRSWEEATLMRQPLFFWYSSSSSPHSEWEVWSKNSLLNRSNVWGIYWGGSPSGGRCVWSRFTWEGGETLNTNVTLLVSWKWLTVLWSLHNIIWVCRKAAGTKPRSGVISAVRYLWQRWPCLKLWNNAWTARFNRKLQDLLWSMFVILKEIWVLAGQNKNGVKVLGEMAVREVVKLIQSEGGKQRDLVLFTKAVSVFAHKFVLTLNLGMHRHRYQ